MPSVIRFFRSKAGRILLVYVALFAAISALVGLYFYNSGYSAFIAQKVDEKATALRLVDAFVTTYSNVRSKFDPSAPVPATFRAHSIESFNKKVGADNPFLLRWVGRQGRQIATAPTDADMVKAIEEFAAAADRTPKSMLLTVSGERVLRTVYPSVASEPSCVECHNLLQPKGPAWRINDVMGAFSIDVPIDTFAQSIRLRSIAVGAGLFLILAGIGLAISIFHFRQLNQREAAAAQLETQNIRFDAALNNMSQGLCMFDANRRLVVSNQRYGKIYQLPPELLRIGTHHEAIIKHRVTNGILAGERTDAAADQKLSALNKHSTDKASSRVDRLSNGRFIKVTREPLAGGGWLATHEDVTEQTQRTVIDTAIASFRSRVEGVFTTVNDCTKALRSTATDLFGSSERASQRASGIVQASQGASQSVGHAASATQQMSASAAHIGQQIDHTTQIVQSAVNTLAQTHNEFADLSNAAKKIGDVISLIQQISGQTNLLALNATIEAARAGSSGRGFAVVASEVKSLASQTRNATEEVAGQILAVQTSTEMAIKAVKDIERCIDEIRTHSSRVAGSIEEQQAATVAISSNVTNAAGETTKIVSDLAEVANAAVATRHSAETVLSASASVEGAIKNLRGEVEDFLQRVAS